MFLLVPAYPGSPRQKAVKRLCVCAFKHLRSSLTHLLNSFKQVLVIAFTHLRSSLTYSPNSYKRVLIDIIVHRPVKESWRMRARARASCTPSTTAFHASAIQQSHSMTNHMSTGQLWIADFTPWMESVTSQLQFSSRAVCAVASEIPYG